MKNSAECEAKSANGEEALFPCTTLPRPGGLGAYCTEYPEVIYDDHCSASLPAFPPEDNVVWSLSWVYAYTLPCVGV